LAPGLAGDLWGDLPPGLPYFLPKKMVAVREVETRSEARSVIDGLFNRNSNAGPMLSMGCRSSCMITA
jgi:hypothetical protein